VRFVINKNNLERNSSVFWAWGGFVFLPINIITGFIIQKNGGTILELSISILFALSVMMILAYPAIILSSKNKLNFSESINKYQKNKKIANLLIISVPIINIGWYSIQTSLFVKIVKLRIDLTDFLEIIFVFVFSILFALGTYLYKYKWLTKVGQIGLLCMIILVLVTKNYNNLYFNYDVNFVKVLVFTFQILGTWIYSSVTCVMDVTSHSESGIKAFIYIILATIVADMFLIGIGYFLATDLMIISRENTVVFICILISIWTTNDSNFYSTMCVLNQVLKNSKLIILTIPIISALITILFIKDFEGFIIRWLSLMSWIGIPFGLYWWYLLKKEKNVNSFRGY